MTSCYATGDVEGLDAGGLIGFSIGTLTNSYYDSDHSSASRPVGTGSQAGSGRSTSQLQSPTSSEGIYSSWDDDLWDFRGGDRYPRLKADFDGDGVATAAEFGPQLLVLADEDREGPLAIVPASTTEGTTIGTFSGINEANDEPATVSLLTESDEFAWDGTTLTLKAVTLNSSTQDRYRLVFEVTQGGSRVRRAATIRVPSQNDEDGDGRIGITTLEQLNLMRFDLNGDGRVDAGVSEADSTAYEMAFGIMRKANVACIGRCRGYELEASLDFDDIDPAAGAQPSIWASTCTADCVTEDRDIDDGSGNTVTTTVNIGWEPIGTRSDPYTSTFEGNRHTISNIFIDRPSTDDVGLFGNTNGANIRRLGLEGGSVVGGSRTGPLVGEAGNSRISTCYATSNVECVGSDVGGLVGHALGSIISFCYATGGAEGTGASVGGLVGSADNSSSTTSKISFCYATGDAEGILRVGGLVGNASNRSGISSCYATGDVKCPTSAGGLVGSVGGTVNQGGVTLCYATGNVEGTDWVGGLVGQLNTSSVTSSYYDRDHSSVSQAVGRRVGNANIRSVSGRSTSQLQSPTSSEGIYRSWDAARWDFGSGVRYPRLKADFDGDGVATAAEFGPQMLVLASTDREGGALSVPEDATSTVGTLTGTNEANDEPATVTLLTESDEFEWDGTTLTLKASVTLDRSTQERYRLRFLVQEGTSAVHRGVIVRVTSVHDTDSDNLIGISSLAQLNAIRYDLNGDGMIDEGVSEADSIAYEMAFSLMRKEDIACASNCRGYELTTSLDFKNASTDASMFSVWAEGSTTADAIPEGWTPIGNNFTPYLSVFEGNGHTLSSLFIERPSTDYVGLFGALSGTAEVRNLGLAEGKVIGQASVGGLVGRMNEASVSGCYVLGKVDGRGSLVGGLVGHNNKGNVAASYTVGEVVSGGNSVGGLIGSSSGQVADSYAMSNVEGLTNIGSLVGWLRGALSTSYTVGDAVGEAEVGGLVGNLGSEGVITSSYYDADYSSSVVGVGSLEVTHGRQATTAQTRAALQGAEGLYEGWNMGGDEPWSFMGEDRYPRLRIDFNNDNEATVAEFGPQLLVLVGADGAEQLSIRVPSGTAEGTEVGMLSSVNDANGSAGSVVLEGMSAAFELSGSSLRVRSGVTLDHRTERRYRLAFRLEEGTSSVRRPFIVDVVNPNDEDGDGLVDITTLEQLDVVRFDLDGDGAVDVPANAAAYEAAFGLASGEVVCASCEWVRVGAQPRL